MNDELDRCCCEGLSAVGDGISVEEAHSCCHRTKQRSKDEYRALMNRLSRAEGQIRGIRRMLDEDAYCVDILTQVAAANAALNAFGRELLSNHIRSCVATDLKNGDEDSTEELIRLLQKLMK